MAVTGVDWTGVDLSMAVTYTLERVLKAVGDLMSVRRPSVLFDLVRLVAAVEVWRDNRGLFEVLFVLDIAARFVKIVSI